MVTHNPRLTTYASRMITMLDGKIDTDTKELLEMIDKPAKKVSSISHKQKKKSKWKKR
jgi:ABC-type lipoprotein export system ATPase subunit